MPSLAGLFGRKKQPATKQPRAETDSAVSSSPTDYVTADRGLPSSPNGASSEQHGRGYGGVYPSGAAARNTSKLRLPFARKKPREQHAPADAGAAASTASVASVGQDSALTTPPRPSYMRAPRSSTSDSDADVRRLRPPPSKSAIFAAYADPDSALSTRSLPNEPSPLSCPPVSPKKPRFFNWSKSVPKNTPPSPAADSFNLKSFRHVGPPSPSTLLPPAVPRPRGTSTDSSQRISVAAFRDAQARRSAAGSPVPSLRTPSPGAQPLFAHAQNQAQQQQQRRRSSGLAYADSDAGGSDDDDADETIKGRGAGITKALKTRVTKSEVGHGPREPAYAYGRPMGTRAQSSHILTSEHQYPVANDRDRSQSSLGFNVGTVRARASVSTSAVTPSRDAKRASVLAGTPSTKRHTRATSENSVSPLPTQQPAPPPSSLSPAPTTEQRTRSTYAPSNSSSDSDDDAPLASLVPPRRPGSALSSLSSSSNTRPKPLIDINELTRRGRPAVVGHAKDDEGFTAGRTLLGSAASAASVGSLGSLGSAGSAPRGETAAPVKVSVSPPRRFVSPPASPKGASVKLVGTAERAGAGAGARDGIGERLNRALGVGTTTMTGGKPGVGRAMTEPLPLSLPLLAPNASASGVPPAGATRTVVRMRSSTSVGAAAAASASTSARVKSPSPSTSPSPRAKPVAVVPQRMSTNVDDLVTLLGAGVHLIRRTEDDDDDDESDDDDDDDDDDEEESEESEERGRGKARKGKGGNANGKEKETEKGNESTEKPIAPIPIKQRAPPPSFRVTSRPPLNREGAEAGLETPERKSNNSNNNRNSVVLSAGGSTTTKPAGILNFPSGGKEGGRGVERRSAERERERPPAARQRSSTLIPGSVSASSLSPIPSSSTSTSTSASNSSQGAGQGVGRYSLHSFSALNSHSHSHSHSHSASSHGHVGVGSTAGSSIVMPSRPFAGGRRESPAGSSTGDSSSGRAPATPRDGSDVGVGMRHVQRRSVSFEDDMREGGGGYAGKGRGTRGGGVRGGEEEEDEEGEERRKERRRSEAKAAIELGNVINGRGPIVDDDDDDDLPINQTVGGAQARRMSALNPMMGGFGPGMPGWNMNVPMPVPGMNMNMNMGGMGMSPGMLSAPDAGYMAAHQQAMMYAKQAYQMAVAQQAMAAAGDEWERSSAYGGAASVYGGTSPSVVGTPPFMLGVGVGMNMMGAPGGVGAGMGMGSGWSTGSAIFPGSASASARSMYAGAGISGSRSEYGGGAGGGGGWSSSRSSYGDFGASSNRSSRVMSGGRRDSGYFPPVPPVPSQHSAGAASGKGGLAVPRARTASQPATPSKGARRAPPPSSWRSGGF